MSDLKPYCRIDFKDLPIEFDWTICPFSDVKDYLSCVEDNFISPVENESPEFKISVVWMTEAEYNKWFTKNVKP